MIETLQPLISAIAASVVYSLIWYSAKVVDPNKTTPAYDPKQLLATVIVGAVIGAISIASGLTLDQQSFEVQIGTYGFLIAVVENAGSALWAQFVTKVGK